MPAAAAAAALRATIGPGLAERALPRTSHPIQRRTTLLAWTVMAQWPVHVRLYYIEGGREVRASLNRPPFCRELAYRIKAARTTHLMLQRPLR